MEFLKVEITYDEKTKIISTPHVDFQGHSKGLGHLIFHNMQDHFDNISHINVDNGETITFKDLHDKSIRAAMQMQSLGVKPDDIVTICSHNQIDCPVAFLATAFVGAVNASLDPTLAQSDMEHLLGQVQPTMIFVSEECEELVDNVVNKIHLQTKIVVFGRSKSNLEFESFRSPKRDEASFEAHQTTDLTKTFAILFSSGSTGLPKGICLSHNYFLYHTRARGIPVIMSITTIYWISATLALLSSVVHGDTKAMTRLFDPVKAWEYLDTYKVDMLQVPPYQAINLISKRPKDFVSSLKSMAIIGGGTTTEYLQKIKAALPKTLVFLGFATTETFLLFNPLPQESLKKTHSVGVPMANITYKIVDPETEETLGFNQKGELRVKSEWVFSGYYKKDSSDVWDADGFFKTGDVAYYDEEYCFFITDRIREMFKYRAMHITPVKLESILIDHPEIELAVVIGVPHEVDEHHIAAAVVLMEGSKLNPEDIEKYFNDIVDDRHKIRAGVRLFQTVPMTPTGKINRALVKKMMLS